MTDAQENCHLQITRRQLQGREGREPCDQARTPREALQFYRENRNLCSYFKQKRVQTRNGLLTKLFKGGGEQMSAAAPVPSLAGPRLSFPLPCFSSLGHCKPRLGDSASLKIKPEPQLLAVPADTAAGMATGTAGRGLLCLLLSPPWLAYISCKSPRDAIMEPKLCKQTSHLYKQNQGSRAPIQLHPSGTSSPHQRGSFPGSRRGGGGLGPATDSRPLPEPVTMGQDNAQVSEQQPGLSRSR